MDGQEEIWFGRWWLPSATFLSPQLMQKHLLDIKTGTFDFCQNYQKWMMLIVKVITSCVVFFRHILRNYKILINSFNVIRQLISVIIQDLNPQPHIQQR